VVVFQPFLRFWFAEVRTESNEIFTTVSTLLEILDCHVGVGAQRQQLIGAVSTLLEILAAWQQNRGAGGG
jgi:hypothetical protein